MPMRAHSTRWLSVRRCEEQRVHDALSGIRSAVRPACNEQVNHTMLFGQAPTPRMRRGRDSNPR